MLDLVGIASLSTKEIVERRHGEHIKFLFLPIMGLFGSQTSNEKKTLVMNYELLLRAVFHLFMGKNLNFEIVFAL